MRRGVAPPARGTARAATPTKGNTMPHNLFDTLQTFNTASGDTGRYYSLPALEAAGVGTISRLPVSIRIVLESVLRNCDGKKVTEEHVRQLANWKPNAPRTDEIPFVVARIVLQDFTGVPLLVRSRRDARRRAAHGQGSEDHRAAGAGRPRRRSLGAGRLLRHAGRARPQHEDRVQAQPRALPVPEVGHAGLRHVQGRAARHRHRAPGEPRVPRARRACRRTASTIPTRWSAPTRTRR